MLGENKTFKKVLVGILALFVFTVGITFASILVDGGSFQISMFGYHLANVNIPDLLIPDGGGKGNLKTIVKFSSDAEFVKYIAQAQEYSSYGFSGGSVTKTMSTVRSPSFADNSESSVGLGQDSVAMPDRVSSTNVQVFDIDEADIVKTNGQKIYFSPDSYFGVVNFRGGIEPMMITDKVSSSIMMPRQVSTQIQILNAYPPKDLALDSVIDIDQQANLLLDGSRLMAVMYNAVRGYDVTDAKKPVSDWKISYNENNTSLVTSRLYDHNLYLVLRTNLSDSNPCPIRPIIISSNVGVGDFSLKCTDIYHPIYPVPTDSTYSILKIDPKTGAVKDSVSFVGSYSAVTVYMSSQSIYLAYGLPGSQFDFLAGFIEVNATMFPVSLADKVVKLKSYDLTDGTKMSELSQAISKWYAGLDADQRLKIENEMNNKMSDYYDLKIREMEKTMIVKIPVSQLTVSESGTVPGSLLNQYSLDEFGGSLRVATTMGNNGGFWQFNISSQNKSVSDVYVLDSHLNIIGSVKDLGKGERIYATRFIGERGYVVTYRQTDPFYVLDLSNPSRPSLKGELKIPGYSSYLHPISEDVILGIGQENNQVKLSLFDVSSASNPKELAKYSLNEYWSEALNNPHAFLLDTKNQIFFLPGGQGGYIFSYKNNQLNLVKAVSDVNVKRALYINDYLYIIGNDYITVLNEKDWSKVTTFKFNEQN